MENKLRKIKGVLSTVFKIYSKSNPNHERFTLEQFERFFDTYAREFTKTLQNNGKEYTLALFKALHDQSVRLVTKEPWSAIPFHKSNKEGVSTLLIPILPILRSDSYGLIRCLLSVTRLHEQIRLKPKLILDPIVTPYQGTVDLGEFAQGFLKFLQESPRTRKLYLSLPKLKGSKQLTSRIRSGPNGQAVVTSHYDAVAVKRNPKLHAAITKYNSLLSQEFITQNMDWCAAQCESLKLPEKLWTGKLGLASERAGKTRLFAIGDYWSQNSLQSLHDWVMQILRSLPCDSTFNQNKGFERMLRLAVRWMASFDIEKYTCRVPLELQTIMLGFYTSRDFAQSWEDIVGRREFYVPGLNETVKWEVGQPLGLLSSWAVCTLLHHHLVWYAAFLHFGDHRTFNAYEMLGDDIGIWHKGVGKVYARLLKSLGININISKSKLYNGKKKKLPIFEFAKRVSVANNEISGIPFDLLKVASKSIYNYVDLVLYLVESKLLQVSGDLALPEYLTPKGKYFLEILLWEKKLGRPAWVNQLGNAESELLLLNELRRQVARVRIAGFERLIKNLDKLCYSSNLEQELTKVGVAYSDMLIGYSSAFYHPIVHALNDVGMKMYETLPYLEAIADAEAAGSELTLPQLTEVEYLPLPYMSAHFERPGKRNPEHLRKHSQLVLTAAQQLKGNPYGFVLLNEPDPKDAPSGI